MSASLVGSEMCIRDSPPPDPHQSAPPACRRHLSGVAREGWRPSALASCALTNAQQRCKRCAAVCS
eukprot:9002854-Alexandrium_andersonii.AAC.1